jgi:hypothetical protein
MDKSNSIEFITDEYDPAVEKPMDIGTIYAFGMAVILTRDWSNHEAADAGKPR